MRIGDLSQCVLLLAGSHDTHDGLLADPYVVEEWSSCWAGVATVSYTHLYALIANHLFGATGFYQVITQGDPMISSAEQYLQENYHTR